MRARTDYGNAERLAARHGRDLRYCHPWGQWLVWDGRRWRPDDTEVVRRAKDTVRAIYAEAAGTVDDETRKAVAAWARSSESGFRLQAMAQLAQSEPGLFVRPGELDAGPWLLTLAHLLGDDAQRTPSETLMVKRPGAVPSDLARLRGARLVIAAEAEEGERLAESLVKQLTGGDRIAVRFLHHEWFEFTPPFKLFLATNHNPLIRGTDLAIWRRIRRIPFAVSIPEAEQDRTLPDKLCAELPGILAWAVRGCLAWQRDGLGLPPEVQRATGWASACCTNPSRRIASIPNQNGRSLRCDQWHMWHKWRRVAHLVRQKQIS